MRVGQPAYIKSLNFVPLGKMRKEQSGDANMSEKTAMRSVLVGYLARESRPDLSRPVSILQSRFNKAQVSDIQETKQSGQIGQGFFRPLTARMQNYSGSNLPCVLWMPVLKERKLGMWLCLLTRPCWKEWQLLEPRYPGDLTGYKRVQRADPTVSFGSCVRGSQSITDHSFARRETARHQGP